MIPEVKAKLLDGKRGLIVGIANDQSIAWGCAKAFRALGAELAVTYLNDKAKTHVEPLARQVEAAIVRAIMETESAFNPAALSRAGAIGLMQLMPMTARELGVNPFVPEQNIEGGVRYFSQLLKMFGSNLELALVAYNGGPGYAQRYARGQAALYGETRDYVRKVLSKLSASR